MSGGRAPGLVRQRASSTARSTADSGVQWSVPWDDDAEVQFLVFSLAEGRWIFRHVYRERGDGRRVLTYNEVKLVVDYADGIVSGIELTMRVVFPERLGRVSYLGVDVSPGAKTFLEFSYEPEPTAVASTTGSGVGRGRVVDPAAGATAYRLSRISAGVSRSAEVRPGASDVDSPFPVLARVVPEYGAYSVPYGLAHRT